MPSQIWGQDLAYNYFAATTVTGTTSITALVPDFVIPANYLTPGSKLRAVIYGSGSATVANGMVTFKSNWGGTGGTNLATYQPALSTSTFSNLPFRLEYLIVCTAIGSLFVQGHLWAPGGMVALSGAQGHFLIPATAPAVTSGLTFSSAQNLDFSVTPSQTTQTWTSNLYTLESLSL